MKKIVIINGHPGKENLNSAIVDSYINSAREAGSEVRYIAIGALDFNPNLQFGYSQRMELEPDLVKALEDIQWSEHTVWIHPMWWLGIPAIMKGFFDRAFLPGITFKKDEKGVTEGLLKGKTGRIITTAGDLSLTMYEEIYKSSGLVQLKEGILGYCGIAPITSNFIGPLNELNKSDRLKWLKKIKYLALVDSK
ncbi:NAD(P)H-dependent oxidoreductase [Flavobacterium sp. FlaQc-48]|uniref:NAD(P)H-dependent oxidoreductase n=1 Tax=Flavobacterium sp. FlaQc-48 TaxID=3374181 RepID=UPI0037572534